MTVGKASADFVNKNLKSTAADNRLLASRPLPSRLQHNLPDTSESSSQESSSDTDDLGMGARPKVYMYRRKLASQNASQAGETIKSGIKSHTCSSCGNHWDACACTDSVFQALPRAAPGCSGVFTPANPPPGAEETDAARRRPSVRPNATRNRQKQLEALRRYEEKFRSQQQAAIDANAQLHSATPSLLPLPEKPSHPMHVHILDVTQAIQQHVVTWQPVNPLSGMSAPDETSFYTLVEGRGELVLFGGIEGDMKAMQSSQSGGAKVVNSLYFLRSQNFQI